MDAKARTIAFKVPVASFRGFNSELQHEHFDENYMETNKYPEAVFNGKIIEDIDLSKGGAYKVRVKGKLNIHGLEKERVIGGRLTVGASSIRINSSFEVPLEDRDIAIPRVIAQKISETILVQLKADLIPRQ